ncbi:hypothetical protein ACFONC_06365 [Luteimonas soli]|uniref:AI-2E family transporter n=1 Tax=Luteimonas soli TaxID=1648966 RepID=A0ABV7XI05_9GAMM
MSWLALLLVPLALYAAYKLVGVAIKLVLAVVVVVALYWWAAPQMGWPTVSDLVYVFGPDLDGKRIEEVADPSRLAGQAAERVTDHVIDEVAERGGFAQPEVDEFDEVALPLPESAPEADPETPRAHNPPM